MTTRLFKPAVLRKSIKTSLLFYVLSALTSFVNYLFYPAIARFLSVSEYGEIQFLVSMFGQLAVGFVILNILTVVVSVKLSGKEQDEAVRTLGTISAFIATVIAAIGTIILIIAQSSLGLSSTIAIVLLGVALVANVPFTIINGQLQAEGKFAQSGVVSLLSVVIKLISSVGFAAYGMHNGGVVLGIVVGLLAAWGIGIALNGGRVIQIHDKKFNFRSLLIIKSYTYVTIISITILTFLSSADSIVSRVVLSPLQAGEYASVATATKIVLAIATPLMWLVLPSAVKSNYRMIKRYIFATALIGGVVVLCLITMPLFFTKTIVGIDPHTYTPLIPLASLSMWLYSIAFVIVASTICIGEVRKLISTSFLALVSYTGVTVLMSPSVSPLTASLYGQTFAAIIFISIFFSLFRKSSSSPSNPLSF